MAQAYRTKDGDMLDRICWKHYGRTAVVEAVLDANPGLAEAGPVYSAGTLITLPDLPEQVEDTTVKLWD